MSRGYDTPGGSYTDQPMFSSVLNREGSSHSGSAHGGHLDDHTNASSRSASASVMGITKLLPRILLMGLRRSGKSSIFNVVFNKMSPHGTLYLESTSKVDKHHVQNSCVIDLMLWDFPGSTEVDELAAFQTFEPAGALLFVIDAQDEYQGAISRLVSTIDRAFKINRGLFFEVFIHKVDGVSEDRKLELQRDISHQVTSALYDSGLEEANIAFYLSSIYDHSVNENVSKVVQKLLPQLGMLENLLDILISNCRMEKAFLFDVVTKLYIATDSQPVDVESFELCSDMIDVVVDVSCIYGHGEDSEGLPFDENSSSIIKLNNGRVLCLREVSKYLALVCLMREDNLELQGLIEYNIHTFKQALKDLVRAPSQATQTRTPRMSLASVDSPMNSYQLRNELRRGAPS